MRTRPAELGIEITGADNYNRDMGNSLFCANRWALYSISGKEPLIYEMRVTELQKSCIQFKIPIQQMSCDKYNHVMAERIYA